MLFTQVQRTGNRPRTRWRPTEPPLEEASVQERSPAEVLRLAQDEGIEIVDFRFCDLPGLTQHFSVPVSQLTEDGFDEGYGFDGSSIRGFQEIQESDMILVPDPNTAVIDPFRQHRTLNINCFVRDPITGESYSRDPATWPRRPRTTWPQPASPTPPTSVPRLSSSSSTTCASTRTSARPCTRSTRSRASGTRARTRTPTWDSS